LASVTITFPPNVGANDGFATGQQLRKLARLIDRCAAGIPDKVSSGASTVITFDNTTVGFSPGSVQITAGPYQSAQYRI
jgi:hypothetical protein